MPDIVETTRIQEKNTIDYVCPPCKIFYPTLEEFKDPLKYIASIRNEASTTGICKIVPPTGWQPPFAVNEKKFRFRTRLQPLNCIEGNTREEGLFQEALRMFLYRSGHPMKDVPTLNGHQVSLSALYKIVVDRGGFHHLDNTKAWTSVVEALNHVQDVSNPSCSTIHEDTRSLYETYLLEYEAYDKAQKNNNENSNQTSQPELNESCGMPAKRGRGRPKKIDENSTSNQANTSTLSPRRNEEVESNQSTPVQSYGFLKRNRGRPPKEQVAAMRMLITEAPEPCDPSLLEANALAADPDRMTRIDPPIVRIGQKFYRSANEGTSVLGEVKKVHGGKKPSVSVDFLDGTKDTIPYGMMQLILANGSDSESAIRAVTQEICQHCMRADCKEKQVFCESCSSGYHLFCLPKPLTEIPTGDWYCESCMEEEAAEKKTPQEMKFGFEMGPEYTLASFKAKADQWQKDYFDGNPIPSIQGLEREYWEILKSPHKKIQVEYGSDVDTGAMGSGFPMQDKLRKLRTRLLERYKAVHQSNDVTQDEPVDLELLELQKLLAEGLKLDTESNFDSANDLEMYATSPWNLTNLPTLDGSMLQFLDEDIKGVMVPWMYVGMCFSTFCWHVEDHNFYSISYLHRGAPKTWYGVPGHAVHKMEEVMRSLTPRLFGNQPDLHMQLVTMFSPETLQKHGIPVYRATHQPNEFIVTYPSSYHSGFNNGFNLAEAVNFATPDWIQWGHRAVQNYKKFCKIPVFSHDALILTMTLAALEGNDSLDHDSIGSHLLPALQILHEETLAFWNAAQSNGIVKSENMDRYIETLARSSVARGTTRHKLSTYADDASPARPSKMIRTDKMKMGKMELGSNSRISRQVLWAGRTGKHDGLRCSKCHQYCFVAAVVCLKCRVFGCHDHFQDLCKCDATVNSCWLYHVDHHALEQHIAKLKRKLNAMEEWERHVEECTSLDAMEKVLAEAKTLSNQQIGPTTGRMESIRMTIVNLKRWKSRASNIVKHGTVVELSNLIQEGSSYSIQMAELDILKGILSSVLECQREAHDVIKYMEELRTEEEKYMKVDLEMIEKDHAKLVPVLEGIKRIMKNVGNIVIPEVGALRHELGFANWLLAANTLIHRSLLNRSKLLDVDTVFFPTYTDIKALYNSPARKCLTKGWKLEYLRMLTELCEEESRLMDLENSRHHKSVEELEQALKRIVQLPTYPDQASMMFDQWKHTTRWNKEVAIALESKIHYEKAQEYETLAEKYTIPTSSLLRRQLSCRIQDMRRWLARAHGLFKSEKPTSLFSLQILMERNEQENEKSSLVCICQQGFNRSVPYVRCVGCTSIYHPACLVGYDPTNRYMCKDCCKARRKVYPYRDGTLEGLFCICRQSLENVPMICCDFCDEWYHAKCIGLTPSYMSSLEAYRCQACAIRQGMAHVVVKQPVRPTLKQVIGLISRGDALRITSHEMIDLKELVSLGHHLLDDIAAFERIFLERCSLRTIIKEMDGLRRELDEKLEELSRYEVLVQLEMGHQRLRTLSWFLRACQLIFCSDPAPRYSQLIILMDDAKVDKLSFPTPELQRFHREIQFNLGRAMEWVRRVKCLNGQSTKQQLLDLQGDAEEITQYLLLPDVAVTNFQVAMKYYMGTT